MDNPYAVLGLAEDASLADARRAFRRLVKRAHPDAGGDPRTFAVVVAAFEQLRATLPAERTRTPYDAALRVSPPPPSFLSPISTSQVGSGDKNRARRDFATVLRGAMARVA